MTATLTLPLAGMAGAALRQGKD